MSVLPKVSIIISSYNQREYIREAVESALNQTYPNVEVVATDNGSTDGTQEILKGFEGNERVRLILRRENGSINVLANEGFSQSTGEFIGLLHGDDYYLPTKIARQMECFAELPSDYGVVYSPNYCLNVITGEQWRDSSSTSSGSILKDMLLRFHVDGGINIITPLVRRECFSRYRFREDFFMEGESIFFRMAIKYKFHYLDEPLSVMRNHLGNMGKAIRRNRETVVPIFEMLGKEKDFPIDAAPALSRFLGRVLRNYGWQGLRVLQDPRWARECFSMAVRFDPLQILHPRTIVGAGISVLPPRAVSVLNRAANYFIKHRENVVIKEDYT